MSMEQIVRPFETKATIHDKEIVVTSVIRKATEKAILVWGAAGTQPTPYATGISFKVKDPFGFEEFERKSTDVRIVNPNDSTQYVETKRIDSITFKKKKTLLSPETENSGTSGGAETNTATKTDTASTADAKVSDTTTETIKPANTDEYDKYTLKNSDSSS